MNGETKTGVTTFYINEDIDTGAILKQESVAINATESAGDLHDKLMTLGSKLIMDTIEMIRTGKAKPVQQEEKKPKLAPKLNKDNCRINWELPKLQIYNQIRGLCPYPGAWTILENGGEQIELKIYETRILVEPHKLKNGTIIKSKKNIKIAVQDGFLDILELKIKDLPKNWNTKPPALETQYIGDDFVSDNKAAILKVPSSIVPLEYNFLINPHHPDTGKIKVTSTSPLTFDERFKQL